VTFLPEILAPRSTVLDKGRSVSFFFGCLSIYFVSNYFQIEFKDSGSVKLMAKSALNLLSQRWKEMTLGLRGLLACKSFSDT